MTEMLNGSQQYQYGGGLEAGEQWYLIREDFEWDGRVLGAGTPVLKTGTGWQIPGADTPVSAPLDGRVCRTEYAGLSLHLVARSSDGALVHKRLGSDDPLESLAPSRVISPPHDGRAKLYLAFGDQFYPLEYFGW